MRLRDDAPGALLLRSLTRNLFPSVDADATRVQARLEGSKLFKLGLDSAMMSSTYRFDLLPGQAPSSLLIQAQELGPDPDASPIARADLIGLSCYPHPNQALLDLMRALGNLEARERGEPPTTIVSVSGPESSWDKKAIAATSVARLIVEACLWQEADLGARAERELEILIPIPDTCAPGVRIRRLTGL